MSKINFQGVFQGPGRNFQNSRSFPGIPGAVRNCKLFYYCLYPFLR
jgi:hypothetical protein